MINLIVIMLFWVFWVFGELSGSIFKEVCWSLYLKLRAKGWIGIYLFIYCQRQQGTKQNGINNLSMTEVKKLKKSYWDTSQLGPISKWFVILNLIILIVIIAFRDAAVLRKQEQKVKKQLETGKECSRGPRPCRITFLW